MDVEPSWEKTESPFGKGEAHFCGLLIKRVRKVRQDHSEITSGLIVFLMAADYIESPGRRASQPQV